MSASATKLHLSSASGLCCLSQPVHYLQTGNVIHYRYVCYILHFYYLRHRLASGEGIVMLGICVCVCLSAELWPHATLVPAALSSYHWFGVEPIWKFCSALLLVTVDLEIHCVQKKKHPLLFSAISPWWMLRFIQNFQGMFKMNEVLHWHKSYIFFATGDVIFTCL